MICSAISLTWDEYAFLKFGCDPDAVLSESVDERGFRR